MTHYWCHWGSNGREEDFWQTRRNVARLAKEINKMYYSQLKLEKKQSTTEIFARHAQVIWRHPARAISYMCSIVTQSSSPAVFEIISPKLLGWRLWPYRSRDVIGHVTIRFAIWHSVLVVQLEPSLSLPNRFRDIWPQQMLTNTPTHTHAHQQTRRIAIPPSGGKKRKAEHRAKWRQ